MSASVASLRAILSSAVADKATNQKMDRIVFMHAANCNLLPLLSDHPMLVPFFCAFCASSRPIPSALSHRPFCGIVPHQRLYIPPGNPQRDDTKYTKRTIDQPPPNRNSPEGAADHRVGNDDCLLYTSDAADERSSVDLGG